MVKLDQVIIVEGKYDKIRLSSFIDALIIPTNGFRIFKDKKKLSLIKELAKDKGIIIMTDSDSAGFIIRNHLKGVIAEKNIKNVYIPSIKGKEKRKDHESKEGTLGVEGLSEKILLEAMEKAGVLNPADNKNDNEKITNMDFYDDGLLGGKDSKKLRSYLVDYLKLPPYLSTKALLDVLNYRMDRDTYKRTIKKLKRGEEP